MYKENNIFKKENIDYDFLKKTLNQDIENNISELHISSLLAGFSLGAVVALLFVKPSTIVTIMFICSIFSSWLFIVSILSLIFSLESFRTKLKYLKYYNSIEIQYNEVRKSHNSTSWGSKIFLLGLLFFIIVLTTASFFVSIIFGFLTIILGLLLVTFLFRKNLFYGVTESDFFKWEFEYDEID